MSATYHYSLAELSAAGVADISISYRSLEADTASLRIPLGATMAAPLPWGAGDRIIISDERVEGCPRLFNGRVKRLNTALTGAAWSMQVELAGDIDVLDATTFAYVDDHGEVCYAQSFYSPRAVGESKEGERLTSSLTVCERCFDWALEGGAMDCSRDIRFDATIMGIAGTGSQSCWSLTRSALKWVPDACTAMRYSAKGDVLQYLTARDMPTVTLDAAAHRCTTDEGAEPLTFNGITSCELTPRPDLVPPVCAVTGRARLVLPEGGDVRTPGAFIYHVREAGGSISREVAEEVATQAAAQAAVEKAPKQTIRGNASPLNIANAIGEVNMRDKANWAPESLLSWWKSFGTFALLGKMGASNLSFGNPLFEPVAAADAYPPGDGADGAEDDEANAAPANYDDSPQSWGTLYLFTHGSFPASTRASRNLSGLKWCRGKLSQYVWLQPGASIPSTISKEQVLEFFSGTYPVEEGGRRQSTRYALMRVEGVWINLRSVSYREGDNKLEGASDSPSTDTPETEEPETGGGSDPDYAAALSEIYASTRKLYYDGTLTLTGVRGNPGDLLSTGLNIEGLLPEWATMATPCNAIYYDPIARRATLKLGSRERLTMDELLERQRLGEAQTACRLAGNTDNPLDTPPTDDSAGTDSPEEEEEEEEEPVEMIAPNINAFLATSVSGKPLNPFDVYAEGAKWMMNGGPVQTPDGWQTVEPKDITEHYATNRRFFARWSAAAGEVVYRYVDLEA